jgi:hypothetical protein
MAKDNHVRVNSNVKFDDNTTENLREDDKVSEMKRNTTSGKSTKEEQVSQEIEVKNEFGNELSDMKAKANKEYGSKKRPISELNEELLKDIKSLGITASPALEAQVKKASESKVVLKGGGDDLAAKLAAKRAAKQGSAAQR